MTRSDLTRSLGIRIRAGAIALAAAIIGGACGPSVTGPAAPSPAPAAASPTAARPVTEHLTVATTLVLTTLDGILSSHVESSHVIYDPLIRVTPDGNIVPALATKWTGNADASEWTFTLRSGVKFTDGSPVTADDVVWSYTTVLDSDKSQITPNLRPFLDSARKVSETEVVFKMKTPFAAWPRQTTLVNIVPKKAYETIGAAEFASRPVGSGPYKVASFIPNQEVVYEVNKDYWGAKPTIPRVTSKFIANETTRLTALQARSVDVAILSPATAETARKDDGLTVQAVPSNNVSYIGFNVTAPGLTSVKLRQAIDMAIDREAIAKTIFKGDAKPIGQLLAPTTFGHDPSFKPTAYDPTKAKQLVQESGYDGRPITFAYPIGTAVAEAAQIAQVIEGYLKAVGVNITLKAQEQATLQQDWINRRFAGMYMFSWQPSTLDANIVFSRNFLSSNSAYAKDPTLEELVLKQAAQSDVDARKATLVAAMKRSNEMVYYAPLLNADRIYAWTKAKTKVTPRGDGYLMPQYMSQP